MSDYWHWTHYSPCIGSVEARYCNNRCASFHIFNPIFFISFHLRLSIHRWSSMKEMSLSWSQSVLELLPSAVSSSELLWFVFFFFFNFLVFAGLDFLLVFSPCLDDEAQAFCVELIVPFLRVLCVQVPEAYLSVGVITMVNKRSLCCRKYDRDVSSCLYMQNDAQAALIRFLISSVSCC